MNDLEVLLSRQPLAAPPAELDERVARIFAAAALPRPQSVGEGWWWPAAVGAFSTLVLLLALLPHRPAPVCPPVQVHFEPNAALRRLLLTPSTPHEPPPRLPLGTPST